MESGRLVAAIGAWSYPAFERAMRGGVHRDGHHLYPAHPYTSFSRASEPDLQALYAYLMTQPAVAHSTPRTALRFPFSLRAMMAACNTLFLRPNALPQDANRSDAWNRGAYLVEGLGHCGACHTGRNWLSAERGGRANLGGGFVDGWEAPALNGLSRAPRPWDEAELYAYLRSGRSTHHGCASGPMADVVNALAPLPDTDIRAIATYLASLAPVLETAAPSPPRASVFAIMPGATLFSGACASCHETGGGLTALSLNTNLHSAHPDNLLQVILNGVRAPATRVAGALSDDGTPTTVTAMPA